MRKFLVSAVLAAIFAAPAAAPAVAAVPSGNLLANPAGEAPPSLDPNGIFGTPQGWSATVAPVDSEQGPYDACYGGADGEVEALESSVGAAIGGGARYFFAGFDELGTLEQEIPVPAEAGGRTLRIGGDFGGWESQEDHATLTARFRDGIGGDLGTAVTTPPVTAADRGEATALLPRAAAGTVPVGTRTVLFVLTQTREEGSSNDGYADNLYATFDGVAPAPPTPQGDPACPLAATPVTRPPAVQPPAPAAPHPAPASTPPAVTITRGPGHETASTAAVFAFAGTAGGRDECSLDGGPWRPCTSGHDFGPARPGDHLFRVREKLDGATGAIASYRWTVDLPRACVLRVARARVFVYAKKDEARLVIHYTTYRPATVRVAYSLKGSKGALQLGSATGRFRQAGVFRLPERLTAAEIAKVRAAKGFAVHFRIARTPKSCGRFYTKRLTIPHKVSGQTVWFQSDSSFAAAG